MRQWRDEVSFTWTCRLWNCRLRLSALKYLQAKLANPQSHVVVLEHPKFYGKYKYIYIYIIDGLRYWVPWVLNIIQYPSLPCNRAHERLAPPPTESPTGFSFLVVKNQTWGGFFSAVWIPLFFYRSVEVATRNADAFYPDMQRRSSYILSSQMFGSNSRFAKKNLIFKILRFPFQKEILRFRNMPPDFETDWFAQCRPP